MWSNSVRPLDKQSFMQKDFKTALRHKSDFSDIKLKNRNREIMMHKWMFFSTWDSALGSMVNNVCQKHLLKQLNLQSTLRS